MPRTRRFALLAALALALPLHAAAQGPDHVVLASVYYDTFVNGEADETVQLVNPTGSVVDLGGWKLTDGEGTLTFPSGASIAAGATVTVTGNASAYRIDLLGDPQWEYLVDSDPGVPQLTRTGSFVLANTGDEVRVLKADGTVVDAVAYGSSAGSPGWTGPPVTKVSEGTILARQQDEATGAWRDTDSGADWQGPRVWVAGQSHHGIASFTASGGTTFSSPDSTFDVLAGFIDDAQSSLHVELYELQSSQVGDHLASAARRGVDVRILMEGGPAGILDSERQQENSILGRIQQAGGDVRFMITNSTQRIHDRYDFVHAKSAIADGDRVLAMSGNWKTTGTPADPTYGNREWGIVVASPDLAQYLEDVFAQDFDAARHDILRFGTGADDRYLPPAANFSEDRSIPTGGYAPYFPSRDIAGPFAVTPVLSPDTSLLNLSGLRPLLRGAQHEVLVEQMYAHKHWGDPQNGTPWSDPNPYLEDAIYAARHNGASVHVLLGDEFIDHGDTRNNAATVDYLNGIARDEGLDIHAKLVNSTIAEFTKIHNKGVVVDGHTAVVSSLNWGRNSAQDNRELALLVESDDAASFYRDIFWYDWSPTENKPVTDLTVTDVHVATLPMVLPPVPWVVPVPPPALPQPALPFDPMRHLVSVTIEDVGHYGAGDFDVLVTATPTFLGEQETVLAQRVNAIARGQSLTLTAVWDTTLHLGDFTLDATVDVHGEVRETDEDNNALRGPGVVLLDAPGVAVVPPAAPPV